MSGNPGPLRIAALIFALAILAGCGEQGSNGTAAAAEAPDKGEAQQAADGNDSSETQADQADGTDLAESVPDVDIDYEKFVLDNGLTLIVHQDPKAPIVAVNMWYHVGSKDEGPKQKGFAHLFEHLMFQGSENWDGEYFEPFERAGATQMNGTTNTDRTNYFANVPVPALDMALWMESDRMGHFVGAVSEERLKEQTGVVLNEKKQRANQPYGEVWEMLPSNTYPEGHPYSWSTIGSVEDLQAATLDDVRAWFKKYYGPTNATLVIAGDIEPETARDKAQQYFGDIPAGPPLKQQKSWPAPIDGEHRQTMRDRVPQARVYKVWNIPGDGTAAESRLDLAADLLAGSKTSRLYKRLVYEEQIATDVTATIWSKEIGSQFLVWATARPGVPLKKVEDALDAEMQRFLEQGPEADELKRSRVNKLSSFMRGTERIGGFGGKSDILARGEVYHDDPTHYKSYLETLENADVEAVHDTARKWLSKGRYVLEVHPFGDHATTETEVDRSSLPDIGESPDLDLPDVQRTELDNGLKVWLAQRDNTPVVEMQMVLDAGYAADPANAAGTASLALAMMDEGTEKRDALAISAELDRLGAQVGTSSTLDASTISLSAIRPMLDDSLDIYADIVRNPSFPEKELARLKKQRLAQIAQEKSNPTSLALRTIGPLLYTGDHAYGVPLTGSGTTTAVEDMTVGDVKGFHRRWVRPDNATLVVVGDVDMDTLKPALETHFGDWDAPDEAPPLKKLPELESRDSQRVYLIDRPGSSQATVIAGNLAPPRSSDDNIAMTTANAILGGMFNSRLNLNLREAKHWSYGASSVLQDARAQQPFFAYASVQTDKTAPAMEEMRKEMTGIVGDDGPTDEELSAASANLTRSLPGDNETTGELAGTFAESVIFDLPEDYYDDYVTRVRELQPDQVQAGANAMLQPDGLTWVVVGDLDTIEDSVRELGFGSVEVIDSATEKARDDR